MTENNQLIKTGKTLIGKVVSNSMNKTITVLITRKVAHPIYNKMVKKSTKLSVHDENNECNVGDLVEVMACRPISRKKSFKMVNVKYKQQNGGGS